MKSLIELSKETKEKGKEENPSNSVHKECEEMSDELYNVLAGKYVWRSDVAMPELPGQHSKTRGLTEEGGEKIEQRRGKHEQR